MESTCREHRKDITHICLHANCLKFKGLCQECYEQHLIFHQISYNKNKEPFIITYDQCCQQTIRILNNLLTELERTQDKAIQELTTHAPSNLDEIILEVESIRHQINKLFDRYILDLRDKFEQKIKRKVHKIYDEVKSNIEIIKSFQKQFDQVSTMKLIHQNDLDYQVQYQKSHLEDLITQRINQRFDGKIDDDVALHFIGVIQKELEKLVVKDQWKQASLSQQSNFSRSKSLQTSKFSHDPKGFLSFSTVQQEIGLSLDQPNQAIFRNWLFYFEPHTKCVYYLNTLQKDKTQFTEIEIDMDFKFSPGGRAMLAEDGKIYYIRGYNELEYNENNEESFKTIYQFVFETKSLKGVARLITLRNHFSLVSCDRCIYIVGGENHKEGVLTKCEKLNLDTHTVSIINHLLEPSSHHTTVKFNENYIFKFGGCRIHIQDQIEMCQNLIQVYNIERDEWSSVCFPREILQPSPMLLSSAVQINSKCLFIFGGIGPQNKISNQAYQLLIEEEQDFDATDNISSSMGFFFKLNQGGLKQPGYCIYSPIINKEGTIFQLFFVDPDAQNKIVQVFDKKWKELY